MRLTIFIIGFALAATPALAQRGRSGGGGRGGVDLPSGSFQKNRLDLISEMLKLSKDQKKEFKSVMDAAQKEAAPLREQLVKGRAQIAAAIQSGKADELDNAIKAESGLDTQMTAIEMKAFAGIYKGLDAEQKQRSRALFMMMPGMFTRKNWVDPE